MNNPFDYRPAKECQEAFERLVMRIEEMKRSSRREDVALCRELEAGKMLGVLIAVDYDDVSHTLYAFSGQMGEDGFYHPAFVEPIFDYLQPDDYFKKKEAEIVSQNTEIDHFEKIFLSNLQKEYEQAKSKSDAEIERLKKRFIQSKLDRDKRRAEGIVSDTEKEEMIRRSQYEKAELRRNKKRVEEALAPYLKKLGDAKLQLRTMKEKRKEASEGLQQWLFDSFKVLNARGEERSLSQIFAETSLRTPPSGAGECCAPKLLQAAYRRGWRPVSIAEYWYGHPKGGEVRRHGEHYPACRGKCLPVLGWMLRGLTVEPPFDPIFNHGDRTQLSDFEPEIIYENDKFCVINKPSGLLSLPGKGNKPSVQEWLRLKYPDRDVRVAHRLDRDTSGLLIATFDMSSYKEMQTLFAQRKVKKTYIADLEGDYTKKGIATRGCVSLPLIADILDRPRQRVDFEAGKEAHTDYVFISTDGVNSKVEFYPHTGRTHQLRVHAASELGLGMPIVGDSLYGKESDRLHLHAAKISFVFPADGQEYSFKRLVS